MTKLEVLARIDRWHVDKVRRNYTDSNAENARRMIIEKFGDREGFGDMVMTGYLGEYSRRMKLLQAEVCFREVYPVAERIVKEIIEQNTMGLSPAILDEYGTLLKDQFRIVDKFVQGVTNFTQAELAADLSENCLDFAFLQAFGGHRGFAEFDCAYGRGAMMLAQALRGKNKPSLSRSEEIHLEVSEFIVPYIMEVVFGDLPEIKTLP